MPLTKISPINEDGIRIDGVRGTHSKRREARIARRVGQVFELREQGKSMRQIAEECHMSRPAVESILHDQDYIRRRLTSYNEQLRAATPKALKVVHEVLDSTLPSMLSERARMAQWVLESTKTVGKESPVNVFIRGGDTNINLTNDTLEAARAVAAAMRATVENRALPAGEVIDGEIIAGPEHEGDSGAGSQEVSGGSVGEDSEVQGTKS